MKTFKSSKFIISLLFVALTGLIFYSCKKKDKEIDNSNGYQKTISDISVSEQGANVIISWSFINGVDAYVITDNGTLADCTKGNKIYLEKLDEGKHVFTIYGITDFNYDPDDEWFDWDGINWSSLITNAVAKGSVTYYVNGGDNGGNNGGDNGGNNSSYTYYIKHSWGSGMDSDWSWQGMNSNGSTYTYSGYWGGIGANINTEPSDAGAMWFPETEIDGAYYLSVGDYVKFTYHPSSSSLSVENLNNGGGNNGGDNGGNNGGDDNGGNNGGNNDNTKPDAPTGVTANFEGTAMLPEIVVRWNEVSGAQSYNVYRSTSANGTYSKIASANWNIYADSNPKNGTNYYKVTAVGSNGKESDKSSYASASYDKDAVSPCPPTVKGTATSTDITLKWTYSTSTGCGKPTSVTIRVTNPDSGKAADLETFSSSKTSYTFAFGMWADSEGWVKMGVKVENDYGDAVKTVIYNYKTNTWY